MGGSLDDVMGTLPADRREKVKARASELIEKELLSRKNNPRSGSLLDDLLREHGIHEDVKHAAVKKSGGGDA